MKPPHHPVRQNIGMVSLALAVLAVAGCGTPRIQEQVIRDEFPLQVGESIQVELTGTPQAMPPMNLDISDKGTITLPLIPSPIMAAGRTPNALVGVIKSTYIQNNYNTVNATVTIVPSYYYVSGEINQAGGAKQLYTGHVTVLGAIKAVGGFNDFAARTRVKLTRQDGTIYIVDCKKALRDAKLDLEVLPGDKILVDF